MRPGQAAPECCRGRRSRLQALSRFNEAGAGCPGMPPGSKIDNEKKGVASMRPGQAAPECA